MNLCNLAEIEAARFLEGASEKISIKIPEKVRIFTSSPLR
jgi:hypothetical protein